MPLTEITIPKPDDWHLHVRDGAIMKSVLPFTARHFARAVIMPNLKPPITTSAQAKAYRARLLDALPEDAGFAPLMTAYLTDTTDPDDLARGREEKILLAAKLYPAGATTNSENGVTDIKRLWSVFERMQQIGMPLSIHGEVTDPDVDFFDREAVFIDRVLAPLRKDFPALKIVLEHVTTRHAAQFVADHSADGRLAATVTAHHLFLSRNALFEGGIRPHLFCLPILKREEDRLAIVKAATSGSKAFFVGTDSAPHPRNAKESAQGPGGLFTAPFALSLYAEVFDKASALDKLESFLSRNGPSFYGLPVNEDRLTLEKSQPAPIKAILTEDGVEIVPFAPATSALPCALSWRVRE